MSTKPSEPPADGDPDGPEHPGDPESAPAGGRLARTGAMVGILVAIVAFVALVGRLTTRVMVGVGAGGLAGAVLVLAVLQALRP